jgi:hypothetical protein
MLLWWSVLGAEVAIVLGVRAVLGRRILLVVRIAIRGLVDGLVWWRRAWGRSHPPCAGYRALAMGSATTGIEASGRC